MKLHRYPECGWEMKAPDHVVQVWHPCSVTRTRRKLDRRDHAVVAALDERYETQRIEWARTLLGDIADRLDDKP